VTQRTRRTCARSPAGAGPLSALVGSVLGRIARQAFEDFKIESSGAYTCLIADLDQAALHGALNRIQSLGLELVGLTRMSEKAAA
jgi:hypothetical protein